MARDFTLTSYRQLLIALKSAGYRFLTFEQYCDSKSTLADTPFVILRHDVDARPANSLRTAQIEHELGICASYYFRVVPASNQPGFIRSIAALGHEIGYHYEDMSLANGDIQAAIKHFGQQLSATFIPSAPSACTAHLPANGTGATSGKPTIIIPTAS